MELLLDQPEVNYDDPNVIAALGWTALEYNELGNEAGAPVMQAYNRDVARFADSSDNLMAPYDIMPQISIDKARLALGLSQEIDNDRNRIQLAVASSEYTPEALRADESLQTPDVLKPTLDKRSARQKSDNRKKVA